MGDTNQIQLHTPVMSIAVRPAGQVEPQPLSTVSALLMVLSVGLSAYHGYRRNRSIGWAAWWAFCGGLFPVVTPAIALAQGFGQPRPGLRTLPSGRAR